MSDTRELRLFAAAARDGLTRDLGSQLDAQYSDHDQLAAAVAAAGRGRQGRARVVAQAAHLWVRRVVVLEFLKARGWERADARDSVGERWAVWRDRFADSADSALWDEPGWIDLLVPADLASWSARAAQALGPEPRPETLAWLHQHWFAERRRDVYGRLGTVRADADEVRAVTQVFTPDWVAKVLLDNSLAHVAGVPGPFTLSASSAGAEGAATPVQVAAGSAGVTVLDPACGTGLLLAHAFDTLRAAGRTPAQSLASLRGIDIDADVVAMASLVLRLKAWNEVGGPHATAARSLPPANVRLLRRITFTRDEIRRLPRIGANEASSLAFWNQWRDVDVFGSLLRPDPDAVALAQHLLAEGLLTQDRVATQRKEIGKDLEQRASRVLCQALWLTERHDVVVANPPYLGTRHMGQRLRDLASEHYPVTKGDLCTMFLERTLELVRPGGYAAVVASESWFFTTRTLRVRQLLLTRGHLRTAVCIDGAAFGVRLNTAATVMQVGGDPGEVAFTRVGRLDLADATPAALPVPGREVHRMGLATFAPVPDHVLVFDLPPALLALYAKGAVLGDVIRLRQGMATTDNARFVRRVHEVPPQEVDRNFTRGSGRNPRWVPYNKGGSAVRWWGNQEYVLLWEDDARELREVRTPATVEDRDFFRPSISWSNIGRNGVQFRAYPPGFVFDVAGMSAFVDDERTRLNLMGYLNSPLVRAGMAVLAPTVNYQVGDVARLPAPDLAAGTDHERVAELVRLTRQVWAMDPASWEYVGHPAHVRPEATARLRVEAHVAHRDALLVQIRRLEAESAEHWAEAVEVLTGVPVTHRDPGPLTLAPTASVEELLASAEVDVSDGPNRG